MNLSGAYAAIQALALIKVDDGMEFCVDFIPFKVASKSVSASKHSYCSGNLMEETRLDSYLLSATVTKPRILPQGTDIRAVVLVGEKSTDESTSVNFYSLVRGAASVLLGFVVKPNGGLEASTANEHVFYQRCGELNTVRYKYIAQAPEFAPLKLNDVKVCGSQFGHTSNGTLWMDKGECRKLVLEGGASMMPVPCFDESELMFTIQALVHRNFDFKEHFTEEEINTTLAYVYVREIPTSSTPGTDAVDVSHSTAKEGSTVTEEIFEIDDDEEEKNANDACYHQRGSFRGYVILCHRYCGISVPETAESGLPGSPNACRRKKKTRARPASLEPSPAPKGSGEAVDQGQALDQHPSAK
ncbi:unnamed protein product [Bursaphelenchus okinawaensis]|uniref:Uncharacterized protein n=1 Tax=Bursaphelenchus okinawaensis TaxID=465554 RepID=A0A811KPN5_9BILA|nr:unnamed protein product [Bursaphelenchus okinawaensis]CAG9106984.1 unnamed protein product [Bursaphelenchus okinawaensis]